MWKTVILLAFIACKTASGADPEIEDEELRAIDFLQFINQKLHDNANKLASATWKYDVNATEANLQNLKQTEEQVAKDAHNLWHETNQYEWKKFSDHELHHQFRKFATVGPLALPEQKYTKFRKVLDDMRRVYENTKIFHFEEAYESELYLPTLQKIMATSKDAEERKHLWLEWHRNVGPHERHLFKESVELANESANLNNYTDWDKFLLSTCYEDLHFRNKTLKIWQQLLPLYQQIHAYLRGKLKEIYGDLVAEKGPIPVFMLENFQDDAIKWSLIAKQFSPYPEKGLNNLQNINFTVLECFKAAESFLTSINLPKMLESFWHESVFNITTQTPNCTQHLLNFHKGTNNKIKFCPSNSSLSNFLAAHHQMARIIYFNSYKNLAFAYQNEPSPGFEEAVGRLIGLFAKSEKHLERLNVSKIDVEDPEVEINALFQSAIEEIVPLFLAQAVDLWRTSVINNSIITDDYNCKWWDIMVQYPGFEAPVNRNDEDFDPAESVQNIQNTDFLKNIMTTVLQFQFHYHLCEKTREYDAYNASKPLHKCDMYEKPEAGSLLRKMMQIGASRPWPDALEVVTGQRTIDATGLLEYFKPLQKWLEEHNKQHNFHVGWERSEKLCVKSEL